LAVKHHHFLLAAFILAMVALAGSPSAGADLAAGETRLPSGAIVRIDDAASSADEFKRRLDEKFGTTPEERRKAFEALKSAVLADRLQTKLEIINASNYTVQSICDEYISYSFKPYASTLPPSLKQVVIDVSDRQSRRSEAKCVYKVAQGPKITREDGSPLPDIVLEKVQLDERNTITIAALSESIEFGIQLPEKDILIIVPFATTDILDLAPYLTRAAQKLYSAPAYKGTIINFLAAEKSTQEDTYSLPSLMVMAFKTASGSVVFVESIKFQRLTVGSQDNRHREIVVISAWSFNLAKALSAGPNSEAYKNYNSEGVIRDSTEIFDLVGRYAAEVFKVSQVFISHQAAIAGGKFNVPVVFELDNGVWRILNRHN
jgi:hypothetical protein